MIVGIDLGSTNSAMAYIDKNGNPQIIPNREGERITPSVILFEGDTPIVGSVAKNDSITDPLNTVQFVKRQIGNPGFKFINENGESFTPEELSALILKRLKMDAEEYLGEEIDSAVITVPAYFDDTQRRATWDAGEIAGLNVLKIINEPTAAALSYGLLQKQEKQTIMVYDLGGGTFDVTIMSLSDEEVNICATGGDRNLGGFDFDNKIIEYIQKAFENEHGIDIYDDFIAMQELREKAEACKKTLSSRKKTLINISSEGKSLRQEVTRENFNSMIEPLINRTILIMRSVLEDAAMEWEDIDKILLVGGSTRVKLVNEIIENETGIKPSSEINPDEAVAIGAAIQAQICSMANGTGNDTTSNANKVIKDVNSHSLGVICNNFNTGELMNQIILPRNTQIPASYSQVFTTNHDNQEYVELQVTEGEDEDPAYVRIIGRSLINLPPRPKGSPLRIIISYDENGLIHADAFDELTQDSLGEMKISREANLAPEDVAAKVDKVSKIHIE